MYSRVCQPLSSPWAGDSSDTVRDGILPPAIEFLEGYRNLEVLEKFASP